MAILYNPRIVTDGLVLYLDAANIKSYPGTGTAWSDLSNTGNNGVLTNGPTFLSANSGTFILDGIDDIITCNSSATLEVNQFMSLSIWCYITSTSTGALISKGPSGTDYDYMLYVATSGTVVQFYKKNSLGSVQFFSTSRVHTNRWLNWCVTYNGSTAILYENGNSLNSASMSGNIRTSSELFRIGQGWGTYRGGNISVVKLYNKALSAQEVLQNFNALRGRFGL